MNAASSWDMFLNLETTYPNGGWMYFQIHGDSYMQLSGSDNKVNISKGTTIRGDLDVRVDASQTTINTHFNHVGSIGSMQNEGRWRDQGHLHFEANYSYGEMFLIVRNTFFRCGDYAGNPYVQTFQPLTQSSDDGFEETNNY